MVTTRWKHRRLQGLCMRNERVLVIVLVLALGRIQPTDCIDTCSGSSQASNQICPAGCGTTGSAGSCTACGAGKHKATADNATCTSCVTGKHADKPTAATACMDCVAGKYNSMTTGVTACTDCGAGKASVKMGTAANAETVCVACVAGKYATTASGATTCLHCIAGKYSDVATGVTACTDCGAGKFSEKNASVCVACISGKRGNTATGATACEMIVAGAPNATTPAPTVSENTSVALSAMKYKEVVLTEKAAAVVSIALFAALGATVLGAALGGGPVNSALIDQIQFLSIVGTVGGSQADPATAAFSSGFRWANFDFDVGKQSNTNSSNRRSAELIGSVPTTCDAMAQDLYQYYVEAAQPSGPASQFFHRQTTCIVCLCLVYIVRIVLRRLHVWYHFEDAPPADMAFPGWEGPVFAAQFYGICDTTASLCVAAQPDCHPWMIVGLVWFVAVPLALLCYSSYRINVVVRRIKTLQFDKSSENRISEIRDRVSKLSGGCLTNTAQTFSFTMDARFQGEWVQADAAARFWSWAVTDYKDIFVFFLSWTLAKKAIIALNKNVFSGLINVVIVISVYVMDLLAIVGIRPFRDQMIGFSQGIAAMTNLTGIITASIPFFHLQDFFPDWIHLFVGISTAGTMLVVFTAIMSPLKVIAEWAKGDSVTERNQEEKLWEGNGKVRISEIARFDMMFLGRTKTVAAEQVDNLKTHLEGNGDPVGEGMLTEYESMSLVKKHKTHPAFAERYMVLREGVLRWYRVKDMIVDELDDIDIESSPMDFELRLVDCTVETCEYAKESQFHRTYGPCYGFIIKCQESARGQQSAKSQAQKVMFRTEEQRDRWLEKMQKVWDAMKRVTTDKCVTSWLQKSFPAMSTAPGMPSAPEIPSVKICITIRKNIREIRGVEDDFIEDVSNDITAAVGGRRDKLDSVLIVAGQEFGTITVDMVLHAGFCMANPTLSPLNIAQNLQKQMFNPWSHLREGRITRYATKFAIGGSKDPYVGDCSPRRPAYELRQIPPRRPYELRPRSDLHPPVPNVPRGIKVTPNTSVSASLGYATPSLYGQRFYPVMATGPVQWDNDRVDSWTGYYPYHTV